jgi:hypothetical protein
MQVNINITGLAEVKAKLTGWEKQVNYAASRALNTAAYAINARLKTDMASTFKGGATAYTLSAFSVLKADKNNLTAEVGLRTDAPKGGGTNYSKALQHLFKSGGRDYKKIEGFLSGHKLLPTGLAIAPGDAMQLDRYGNMNRRQLTEIMTMLIARPTNMRVWRKTGRGKTAKAVDYFVILPGAKSKLHPGIYKRIETGKTSAIDCMIMYVNPVNYRKFIDLEKLGREVVDKTLQPDFDKELQAAIGSAK